jgi:hypothetical protein
MSSQNVLNIPPQFIAAAAANLLNCNVTSLAGPVGFTLTQPYVVLNHIRLVNVTGTTVTGISLFKGATGGSAAGTQYAGIAGISIPANSSVDYYGDGDRFDSTTFLSGVAGTASAIVITIDAEIYVE